MSIIRITERRKYIKIGDFIKVKNGASKWMKQQGFWLESMPNSIDGMEGKIIYDYTNLQGVDRHFEVDLGLCYGIGIHPSLLSLVRSS